MSPGDDGALRGRRLGVVWVSSIPSRGALLTCPPCEQLWARGLSSLLAAASLSSVVPSHHLIALSALPQLASSHSSLIDGPTISSFPSSPPPLLTLSFLLSTVPGSQTLLSVPSLPPLSSPYQRRGFAFPPGPNPAFSPLLSPPLFLNSKFSAFPFPSHSA